VLSTFRVCNIQAGVSLSDETIMNYFKLLTPYGKYRCIFMEMKSCASMTVWYNIIVRGLSVVVSIYSGSPFK
jgi:hypothetical protein